MVGSRTGDGLVTLVERKSGYLLLGKLADRRAATSTARTVQLLTRAPHCVHTITADNGSELAGYRRIERATQSRF